jgi:hypothetical protein
VTGIYGVEDPVITESHEATCTIETLVTELQTVVAALSAQVDRWKMENGTYKHDPGIGAPPSASDERLAASAEHLASQVTDLSAAMATLRRDQEQDQKMLNGFDSLVTKLKMLVRFDIGLSAVLFAVGIVLGVFFIHDHGVAKQLETQTQQLTRLTHNNCTLYGLIIPSYREAARQASPLGPAAYDDVYKQIQHSADELSCGIAHKVPGS